MKHISFLLLVFMGFQGCTTSSSDETVHAFETIVYGTVTGADELNHQNIRIVFSVHRNGCDSSGFEEVEIQAVKKTGEYRFLYHSAFDDSNNICHKAKLIYIEDGKKDSILVKPKVLQANWRDEPPYDSTKIDFNL